MRSWRRLLRQHLCLDKGYESSEQEQEVIKQGSVLYVYTTKKKKKVEEADKDGEDERKGAMPFCEKYSPKRRDMERANSWHDRFRKLLPVMRKKDSDPV